MQIPAFSQRTERKSDCKQS
ncbi:MAG: hypothetical protein HDR18_04585 [Lachnospiraceae bacterium]|nr:hypothetical protein [Lachnospiraceae bacterium]